MVSFIEEWGGLLKNIGYIITFIGVIWGILKKLNKISDSLTKIPTMQKDLSEIQMEMTKIAEEKNVDEQLIKEIKIKLDEHCAKDQSKQKMSLDMARQILLNEMEKAIKEGEVTVSRKAVIGELYDSYINNNGNGVVHDLWAEFVHLKQK